MIIISNDVQFYKDATKKLNDFICDHGTSHQAQKMRLERECRRRNQEIMRNVVEALASIGRLARDFPIPGSKNDTKIPKGSYQVGRHKISKHLHHGRR